MKVDVTQAMDRYAALGPDFLTWLLVHTLKGDLEPPNADPNLTIDIRGQIQFASEGGEATKVTMAGDDAPSAPEVFSALRQGKRLFKAKLVFESNGEEWEFTLDGSTFDMRSTSLPVPAMADLNEFMSIRLDSLMRLYHYLDELYDMFLPKRLEATSWKAEVASWRDLSSELGLKP